MCHGNSSTGLLTEQAKKFATPELIEKLLEDLARFDEPRPWTPTPDLDHCRWCCAEIVWIYDRNGHRIGYDHDTDARGVFLAHASSWLLWVP